MATFKEKRFFVLEVDKINRNQRAFSESLVKMWLNSDNLKDGGLGFDIECAIDEGNYEYEFIKEDLIIGRVTKLELEGKKLFASCKFKIEGDIPYLKEINEEKGFLDKCTVVPKGKGSFLNRIVKEDYELYGFNLILENESAFVEEQKLEISKQTN